MEAPLSNDAAGDVTSKSSNIALQLAMQATRSKRPSGLGMSEISCEIRMYHDSLSADSSEIRDAISYWDSHLFARNPVY